MGVINGLLLTRLHLPHPFIATLGTMNVARGLALIITGAAPISGFDRAGAPQVLALGAGTLGIVPVAFLVVILVVYVIFHLLLSDTALGRHIYAVGGNTVGGAALGDQRRPDPAHRLQPQRVDGRVGRPDAGRPHQLRLSHGRNGLRAGRDRRGHHRRRQLRRAARAQSGALPSASR